MTKPKSKIETPNEKLAAEYQARIDTINIQMKTFTLDEMGRQMLLAQMNLLLEMKAALTPPLPSKKSAAKKPKSAMPPPAATTQPLENRWHIVLDASGSMHSIARAAVAAVNSNFDAIRAGDPNQSNTVAFTVFGGERYDTNKVRPVFGYTPAKSVAKFEHSKFYPNGGTPLFDAVGHAIESAQRTPNWDARHVSHVLVVVTDGEENTSTQLNAKELVALIKSRQATDCWTFVFLLPPGAKASFCRQFNVPEGNVQEWESSERGVTQAATNVSQGIGQYMTNRSTGARATKSFFTTDLSNVKTSDVKANLTDMKGQVHVWTVGAECAVKDFCETQTGTPYKAGNAFYQLTKSEKIQDYKKIYVMAKGARAVYGGDNARQVLGLPSGDVNVKPGNHSNWDIFVQSTSVNRKLVRGTKLIYVK